MVQVLGGMFRCEDMDFLSTQSFLVKLELELDLQLEANWSTKAVGTGDLAESMEEFGEKTACLAQWRCV